MSLAMRAQEIFKARPNGRPIDVARLVGANINPRTLLATDYLNHFHEATMILEMLPKMPDCIDDLADWRPLSYVEHFAASTFKGRELAVEAYELADPIVRGQLDDLADEMNAILGSTIEAIQHSGPMHAAALAETAVHRIRPLVAQAAGVINGTAPAITVDAEADAPQVVVDALFADLATM